MEPEEFQQLMKARQNVYDLLRCFFLQEPAEEFLLALKKENILIDLIGYHKDLDEGVELISSVIFPAEISAHVPGLLLEFTRLFIGPVPIPLYESVYRSETGLLMQEKTLEVRKKYLEAGLVINPEEAIPDDHIGAELEFVFYLCQKSIQAENAARRDFFKEIQYCFLKEHLTAWVSPFCDRLWEETESPYFRGVAKLTKGFVHWDYQEIVSHFYD